jgi:phosphoserine phosphatase
VFELSLTEQNLLSHDYFYTLVQQSELSVFCLSNNRLTSPLALPTAQPSAALLPETSKLADLKKLIVFAEGLHIQKLLDLSQALDEYLTIHLFKIIRVQGVTGFAVCAYVTAHLENLLKAQLENAADQFSVELCLVDNLPKLSEPGLLLMDMDSTVIAVECIDEIALLAGVGDKVSKVTEQAMQGKLDFADSLRSRVACLAGANTDILQQVLNALPLMPGVANLVRILQQNHWKVAIASGGFSYFADYLKSRLNLDAAIANGLEFKNGQLTGNVEGAIVDAEVKAQTLNALAEKWSIPASQTIAMGDGANDLLMLNAAALGVALHAKPIVRQQADIAIRRSGLDTLLWVLAA